MELNSDSNLYISKGLPEHQAIPKTNTRTVVHIWSISTPSKHSDALKEQFYTLLRIYWSANGILDCKMLEDPVHHNFIIIETWKDRESQKQFCDSLPWQQSLKTLTAGSDTKLKEITNSIFELIE